MVKIVAIKRGNPPQNPAHRREGLHRMKKTGAIASNHPQWRGANAFDLYGLLGTRRCKEPAFTRPGNAHRFGPDTWKRLPRSPVFRLTSEHNIGGTQPCVDTVEHQRGVHRHDRRAGLSREGERQGSGLRHHRRHLPMRCIRWDQLTRKIHSTANLQELPTRNGRGSQPITGPGNHEIIKGNVHRSIAHDCRNFCWTNKFPVDKVRIRPDVDKSFERLRGGSRLLRVNLFDRAARACFTLSSCGRRPVSCAPNSYPLYLISRVSLAIAFAPTGTRR